MAEEWSYRRLCDTYREEKSTNSLVTLPSDFHRSLQDLVHGLQGKANAGSPDASRELENARKQAWVLMRLRRQKIVVRALVDADGSEPEGLTAPEHALYERVRGMQKEEEEQLASMLHPITTFGSQMTAVGAGAAAELAAKMGAGQSTETASNNGNNGNNGDGLIKKESAPAPVPAQPQKKVRILKDIPAYRGADETAYGPYTSGSEVEVPGPEAEWMVRGQLACEIGPGGNAVYAPAKMVKMKITMDVPEYTNPEKVVIGPFRKGQEAMLPDEEARFLERGHLGYEIRE